MRKITMMLLLVGSLTIAKAQEPTNQSQTAGPKKAEKLFAELDKELDLNQEQELKVKTELLETAKTMKANREKYKGNDKCLHQAQFQAKKASEERIKAFLSGDQAIKFDAFKKRKEEERRKKKEEELMKPINC